MANYLYNGVKLPELPEYDTEKYKNALITRDGTGVYRLRVINKKPWYTPSTTRSHKTYYDCVHVNMSTTSGFCTYALSDGAWVEVGVTTTSFGAVFAYGSVSDSDEKQELIWSNWDILDSDDVLYFAASDPVPVNPPDPLSLVMGYRVGCAIRANRGKKQPVAYLYNGVQLPPLPEWDREMYPYAVIAHMRSGTFRSLVLSPSPLVVEIRLGYGTTDDYFGVLCDDGVTKKVYFLTTDETAWKYSFDGIPNVGEPFAEYVVDWSNADVCGADGTLLLSASDPVPVYE